MLTEKDYCDYDTCVALKELGFNNLVDWYFNGEKSIVSSLARYRNTYIPRVSLYEAQKFLREEKGIHVVPELGLIHRNKNGITHYYRVLVKNMNSGIIITLDNDRDDFESYEEALSEDIKEAVKILKRE